ncbi:Piwi-domain-containing protein [Annulohypoxylon truncatum]|uniref:Piwi-domain-containing protein n=1 Tax=Annulohypoxylon truncatum TaxID=327061 RepID=UPI002008446F|nr:Piwi-domain-containing protein [Annulohypoxylon truncatum]KAI1205258.1 Piwi-domain-containing protein [Annulohypoxylon truncatum]
MLRKYSIKIEEEQQPTGKKLFRIIKLLLEEIQKPESKVLVTDFSSILISCEDIKDIKAGGKTFTIPYYSETEKGPRDNAKSYQIKVQLDETLPISALENYLTHPTSQYINRGKMVQALNIFLNYYTKDSSKYCTIGTGRSFPLDEKSSIIDLKYGLVAIKGYYSSICLATSRILANINVSYGMFYESKKLEVIMKKYYTESRWDDPTLRLLGKFLRGVRIEYSCKDKAQNPIRRRFRIHDLASQDDGMTDKGQKTENSSVVKRYGAGPKEVSFWVQDRGKYSTVFDFFEKERNTILDTEWPVVNVGSRQKPTYLPAQLCTILPGQRAKAEGNTGQTTTMIGHAVRNPVENMEDIVSHGMKAVGLCKDENPMMNRYGFRVPDGKLITVKSRVLPTPTIRYSQGKPENQTRWNLNFKSLRPPSDSRKWSCRVLRMVPHDERALELLRQCFKMLKNNGIEIKEQLPPVSINVRGSNEALKRDLSRVFKYEAKGIDCMIVILPDSSKALYNQIKRLADKEYGVTTICIVASTLTGQNSLGGLAGNLALKFNLKFRNNNQSVDNQSLKDVIDLNKTMVVGIDVTHSPIEHAPSIAGMVASIDAQLGQWPAVLRRQKEKGAEMVEQLEDMLKTRLQLWGSRYKRYPENILIYRDGVSQGQYDHVRKHELPKLREACTKLYPKDDAPKITIIVVGKRHHTRFYKQSTYQANGNNPQPGTVVDRGVTEALNWDFFLQSHKPLRGTARPAHYFVVHDEIFRAKFGAEAANKLETFTHSLCYLFGRSTTAVSICTPAYYADIVCQRARCYADDLPGLEDFEVHDRLKNTMFYI